MDAGRRGGILGILALCAAVLTATPGVSASLNGMQYTFSTGTYDAVFDHHLTQTRYTKSMNIVMSLTLDTPLEPGLNNVPFDPSNWSYDDGLHAETGTDTDRFNGYISTDSSGSITGFLLQIYLNAPHTPGVWIRRDAKGDTYSTAISREVLVGYAQQRCIFCEAIPVTEWAQDRATGSGNIAISMFNTANQTTTPAPLLAAAVVPLPLPFAMIVAGLASLFAVGRLCRSAANPA